jgi:hypothetical protein
MLSSQEHAVCGDINLANVHTLRQSPRRKQKEDKLQSDARKKTL